MALSGYFYSLFSQFFGFLSNLVSNEIFLTIMAGVSVYVAGRLIVRVIVEPIHEISKMRGRIASNLVYYGNKAANTGVIDEKDSEEVRDQLRKDAADLLGAAHRVIFYGFWARLGLIPNKHKIDESSGDLIGLSNKVGGKINEENWEDIKNIREKLNLEFSRGILDKLEEKVS